MHLHRALISSLLLAAALLSCTPVPKTLAPVPEELPEEASAYPLDAVHAMRGIIGHLQGLTRGGVRFTPDAHHALAAHGFDYPDFSIKEHRLLHYSAREDGPEGRYASGSVTLTDRHGRRAGLVYSTLYTLDKSGMTIDVAQATPLYSTNPDIRVFLVPKEGLPAPAAAWAETYEALRRLDSMPQGGLVDARALDSHALALFVMDRTSPETDVQLSLDIPELRRILPVVTVSSDDYRDYDGWRVAIVQLKPAMQAGL